MLTKNDLLAIKSIVKDEIRAEMGGLKSTVSGMVSDVDGLKFELNGLKDTIADLKIEMDKKTDKNTGDLVDLITKGFGI